MPGRSRPTSAEAPSRAEPSLPLRDPPGRGPGAPRSGLERGEVVGVGRAGRARTGKGAQVLVLGASRRSKSLGQTAGETRRPPQRAALMAQALGRRAPSARRARACARAPRTCAPRPRSAARRRAARRAGEVAWVTSGSASRSCAVVRLRPPSCWMILSRTGWAIVSASVADSGIDSSPIVIILIMFAVRDHSMSPRSPR